MALVIGGSAASFGASGDDRALRIKDRINRFLSQQTASGLAGGALAYSVTFNGERLAAGGFGQDPSWKRPVDEHSVFRIGSITKQFTAAAVLRSIERGTRIEGRDVSIATPVVQLMPESADWREEGGPPIQVGNLLTMTSGLPNFTRNPPRTLNPWGRAPAPDILKALSDTRPSERPGSFEYSNSGYFLLAELIDRMVLPDQTTRTYEQAVRDELLRPLMLKDTGFADDAVIQARIVAPMYRRRPAFLNPDWLRGSADLASSAADLGLWITGLFEGRVLGKQSLEAMLGDGARVDVWTYYGMGWFVSHHEADDTWFHSGAVPGYTSFIQVRQYKTHGWAGVVLLCNGDRIEGLEELADDLTDLADAKQTPPD